jgi:hypothetical protein
VYGPQGSEVKIHFLQELRDIRNQCQGPWLIGGDFNLICCEAYNNNHNLDRAMMGRFRRWINDMNLKELLLHGRRFTWSNGHNNPTLVKLDRVLCSVNWEDVFPDSLLHSSATQDSDNCPMLLGLHVVQHGKRRFHFESFWMKLEGFHEAVAAAWTVVLASSCPLLTLAVKLKATARGLQGWSEKRVGHVSSQFELATELLHQLKIVQDSKALLASEVWLRNNLKKHSLALASLSRTIARPRSRIRWIKDGDANTALFHASARYRKAKNFITSVTSRDGQILTSHKDKAAEFTDFYEGLLGIHVNRDVTIDLHALEVPSYNLALLDAPFSDEEVWETIKHLPSDKALGSNDFTGRFYKMCWPIIKSTIMAAVSCVWA